MRIEHTVFPTLTLDRRACRWADHLHHLTPVHWGDNLCYKRDDAWAPLGPGGINGFKVRQGVWLLERALARGPVSGLIFAGSVHSTQHGMVATLARHYGIPSLHILGATRPEASLRHPAVAVAAAMGARFDFVRVAYNPVLQKRARDLLASEEYAGWLGIEYGVGLGHLACTSEDLSGYHELGAAQALNLPTETHDLIVPAGSCHAAVSILLGVLAEPQLDPRVHLVGLGRFRPAWMTERLKLLGLDLKWDGTQATLKGEGRQLHVRFHDLIGSGWCTYAARFEEELDGIAFHPNYEAKVVRWLRELEPELIRPTTTLWVVGSEPQPDVMRGWASRREEA